MVATRTQTGTIALKRYDLPTLRLNASSPTTTKAKRHPATPKPKSPTTRRLPKPRSPTKAKGKKPSTRLSSPLGFDPRSASVQEQLRLNGLPLHMGDICDGINFFPARAWGEREEVGLSAIQRAEREVEIWEEVRRSHAEGGLSGLVPALEAVVEGARGKVAELREQEREGRREVGVAGADNPAAVAVQERLEILEWALRTSKFEAEGENIRGAMEGYRSGTITYTDHFTLIYAGRIVDTAPTYGDFVRDRQERLDRYAEAHGPHWLWYEPPLRVHPESRPRMSGSLALSRSDSWSNLGCWYVTQGFWKRGDWVNRIEKSGNFEPAPQEANFQKLPDGRVFCQDYGPKQAFRSMLDSGATYPSLHTSDFQKLFIDEENYAAQSVTALNTANGLVTRRCFELFVCVLDAWQRQLVDENNCAWPHFARYLGGLCPVVENLDPILYDAEGYEIAGRLSGLLPFLACYVSCTPTVNALFLGEDRKDVLGAHRMPGQRKWDIAVPVGLPIGLQSHYGDPKTTFSHREGKVIDEDDPNMDFASTLTLMKGTDEEIIHRNCPKEEIGAQRAERAKEEAEEAARQKASNGKVPDNPGQGVFREGSENLPLAASLGHGGGDINMG